MDCGPIWSGFDDVSTKPTLLDISLSEPFSLGSPVTDSVSVSECESEPSDLFQTPQTNPAFAPPVAKCRELTSPDDPISGDLFTLDTERETLFSDNQPPKLSASQSFLEDIFAGLDKSPSLLPDFKDDIFSENPSGGGDSVSLLHNLLDFETELRGTGEKPKNVEERGEEGRPEMLLGASGDASLFWGGDHSALSVEDQIKRNRYYGDEDDDD